MTIKMVQIPVSRKQPIEAAMMEQHNGSRSRNQDRFKQVQDQELDAMDRYLALGYTVVGVPLIIQDSHADYMCFILWHDGPPQPHAR